MAFSVFFIAVPIFCFQRTVNPVEQVVKDTLTAVIHVTITTTSLLFVLAEWISHIHWRNRHEIASRATTLMMRIRPLYPLIPKNGRTQKSYVLRLCHGKLPGGYGSCRQKPHCSMFSQQRTNTAHRWNRKRVNEQKWRIARIPILFDSVLEVNSAIFVGLSTIAETRWH